MGGLGDVGDFFKDVGTGMGMVFKPIYDKGVGLFNKGDKLLDKATDGAGNILDLFAGNSNVLIYIGIGIVAVAVLPVILSKVL
jgi:hypothetical protein